MASTSRQRGRQDSEQQQSQDTGNVYDRLTKGELLGIQKYNESIIREKFAQGVEVGKSVYLQQVLAEQQQIEARLAMLEQQPEQRDAFLQNLPPLPEYILSVKNRAAQRPIVLKGRNIGMSLEEAAMIEKRHAESQKQRPARPKDFGGMSEQEKHAMILNYMNYRDSDDDDDDEDEDESDGYWAHDGEVADDAGAVGGQWVDTNDISHLITVDRDRIEAGGFYTNYVDER